MLWSLLFASAFAAKGFHFTGKDTDVLEYALKSKLGISKEQSSLRSAGWFAGAQTGWIYFNTYADSTTCDNTAVVVQSGIPIEICLIDYHSDSPQGNSMYFDCNGNFMECLRKIIFSYNRYVLIRYQRIWYSV